MKVQPFSAHVRGAALAGAAAAVLAVAPAAGAHDVVIGSNPENGGVIEQFPERIELEFSGEIQPGFNTVALSRTDGDNVEVLHTGEPVLDGRDVSLELPDTLTAEPGHYRVGFQIISSDGHSTKGMTTFTFDPDGALVQASGDVSEDETVAEGNPWRLILGIVGVLALAGAVLAALARQNRNRQTKEEFED